MGKIKGWKKKEIRVNNWVGSYYLSDKTSTIKFNEIQDRDGRNAFIYSAIYKQYGLGRISPIVIAKGRNEDLVRKKAISYMKSHPRG